MSWRLTRLGMQPGEYKYPGIVKDFELRVWNLNWVCGGEALEGVI